MEQLKQVWVYRFWIAIGLAGLMPIIGYFLGTSSLARDAARRQQVLDSTVKDLEKLKQGPNPNDQWVAGVNTLKDGLSKQVDGAWEELFKRQAQFMDWPKEVEAVFQNAKAKGEGVSLEQAVRYKELYPPQFFDLVKRVQPVGLSGSKGLVEMDPQLVTQFAAPWMATNEQLPTVAEAWLAQEDIWILRGLLDVVNRANEDSSKLQDSAVKRIEDIKIGESAGDATTASKTSKELWYGPETAQPAEPAAKGAATAKVAMRYVGPRGIFKQVPVYMQLIVDQPRIVDVLAEFANSGIPMQVMQISFSKATGSPAATPVSGARAADSGETTTAIATKQTPAKAAATKQSAGADRGPALIKEDPYFHMTRLRVWARAFLYEKPESLKARERAQVQALAPSPTQGGTNN